MIRYKEDELRGMSKTRLNAVWKVIQPGGKRWINSKEMLIVLILRSQGEMPMPKPKHGTISRLELIRVWFSEHQTGTIQELAEYLNTSEAQVSSCMAMLRGPTLKPANRVYTMYKRETRTYSLATPEQILANPGYRVNHKEQLEAQFVRPEKDKAPADEETEE